MKSTTYSKGSIVLHWMVALLFGANYMISDGMPRFFDQHLDGVVITNWVANFHLYAGIAFAALVALRLAVRLFSGAPEAADTGSALGNKLAKAAHHSLYLLMILVPAAGLIAWYAGIAIFADIHVVVMNIMLGIIGLHIVATLYHQFILKDNLIARIKFAKAGR